MRSPHTHPAVEEMATRIIEISSFLYDILPEEQKERYCNLRNFIVECIKESKEAYRNYELYRINMRKRPEYPAALLYQDRTAADLTAREAYESTDHGYQEVKEAYQAANRKLYQAKYVFGNYKRGLKLVFETELNLDEEED